MVHDKAGASICIGVYVRIKVFICWNVAREMMIVIADWNVCFYLHP